MSFAACIPVILNSEGGFVIDQGGATQMGVTQAMWAAYKRVPANSLSAADIRALTVADVTPFYDVEFYGPCHCADCPTGLDLMVMDEGVNEGQGRALRHLQGALGVTVDGNFGPASLAALHACDPVSTINAIHDDNAVYYASLEAAYPQDERGWQARNDRTRTIALAMAAAALAAQGPIPSDP